MAFHHLQWVWAAGVPGYSGIIPPASASARGGGVDVFGILKKVALSAT
jgi:hypothetical protein